MYKNQIPLVGEVDIHIRAVIQSATGYLPPAMAETWSAQKLSGLRHAWNEADAAGAFDETRTVGQMAKAFLRFQITQIESREDPEPPLAKLREDLKALAAEADAE